jgi:hypothetical protein
VVTTAAIEEFAQVFLLFFESAFSPNHFLRAQAGTELGPWDVAINRPECSTFQWGTRRSSGGKINDSWGWPMPFNGKKNKTELPVGRYKWNLQWRAEGSSG